MSSNISIEFCVAEKESKDLLATLVQKLSQFENIEEYKNYGFYVILGTTYEFTMGYSHAASKPEDKTYIGLSTDHHTFLLSDVELKKGTKKQNIVVKPEYDVKILKTFDLGKYALKNWDAVALAGLTRIAKSSKDGIIWISRFSEDKAKNIAIRTQNIATSLIINECSRDKDAEREAEKILQKRIDHFINVAKLIYNTVHPLFSYGGDEEDMDHYLWDFKKCILRFNFFGPELVKEIGQEKILYAPAYKIEEMVDGGIMLIAYNLWEREQLKKVTEHFGFPHVVR